MDFYLFIQVLNMSTAKETINTSRLDLYIKEKGPLSWQDISSAFHSFLEKNSDTIANGLDTILFTTASFHIEGDPDNLQLILNVNEKEDSDSRSMPKEAYMSPDHILEADLDERSQVYSIGCVIYECLTGQLPFATKNKKALIEKHIAFEATNMAVHKLSTPVPEAVQNLVFKCLEKDPKARYQNTRELQEALKALPELVEKESSGTVDQAVQTENIGKIDRSPLYISATIMFMITATIVSSIIYVNSENFRSYIYNTRNKNKNIYALSLEESSYKLQMDYQDGKPIPEPGIIPLTITQLKSGKVLFATTQKKTIKEAAEEALRRGLRLINADFREADLRGATMVSAFMSGSDFTGADLSGANLSDSDLSRSNFHFANLKGANLDKARLPFSDLRKVNLEGASLKYTFMPRCNLEEVNAIKANLQSATISGAIVNGADFFNANIDDSMAANIDWTNANISAQQLAKTQQGKIDSRQREKSQAK